MSTTARLTVRKSTVTGWEVVDGDGAVVTVVANREAARAAKHELETTPAVVDAVVVEDDDEVLVDVATEDWEDVAAHAEHDAVTAELDAEHAAELATAGWEDEAPAAVEPVQVAAVLTAVAREAVTAEPTGESVNARQLVEGMRINLRGVGAVTIVWKERAEAKQKYTVHFTDATGAEGQVELWANSRYRLLAN